MHPVSPIVEDNESINDEPKLLETLGIDDDLLRSATPVKKAKIQSYTPAPVPIPASYFKSLRNHTPTHSRQSSVNSTAIELISSPNGLREEDSFVSLKSGNEFQNKVQINDKSLRYSVYVSNDDFEIPNEYQLQEIKGKSSFFNKFKKNGHSNSISNIFNIKTRSLKNHRNTKSVSNIDD